VLLRSAVLLLPAPDVLERSAVELLPAPDVLLRLAPELDAEFAPLLELLVRSWPDVLDELPERPLPEVELASLRGEELLELPVLEPLPVLLPEPLAPEAPDAPDSRTSETVTSGAPWVAGNVTIATPNPFCTPLLEEPLRPLPEEDELPLRPLPDDELPLRPLPLDDEELRSALVLEPVPLELRPLDVVPPLCEESLLDDEPMPPLLEELLRSALVPVPLLEEEPPIPPLLEDEPDRPPLDEPPASEREPLLPRLPLLPLAPELPLLDEFTGQLLNSAGF